MATKIQPRPALLTLYTTHHGVRVDKDVWLFGGIYYSVDLSRKVAPIKPMKDQTAARQKYPHKTRVLVRFTPATYSKVRAARPALAS